jgi:hypothetical protein
MRFYEAGVISDVNSASGFEFQDGTETKRLVMISSGLKVYKLEGASTWTQVVDLENPELGSGLLADLGDVDPAMTPNAGDLLSWDAGSGHWEAVAPASASGKTRFADLDDTPAPVGVLPNVFDPSVVGKLVYVKDTTSLDFTDAPAGVGAPFCMMLKAPGTGTRTINSDATDWSDVYQWAYESFGDDGGFLTDDPTLLTNDAGKANKFVTLDAGLYHVTLWYTTTNQNKWGTRQWKIAGTNSDGPATYGIQQEANLFWQTGIDPEQQPVALPGIQFLGSAMLIQFASGTIKFQMRQDSGVTLSGLIVYAVITKVK